MLTEKNERELRKQTLINSLQYADGHNPSEDEVAAAFELGLLLVEQALEEVFYEKNEKQQAE